MDQFKSSLEQSNALLTDRSPFDTNRISRRRDQTPDSIFENHRLIQMSPNDYYKFVSHQIGSTPDRLINDRLNRKNDISVEDMRKMMREGTKFDTPWLRLNERGEKGMTSPWWQEGLHRMLAAGQEYGMDTKFPVYIGYEDDPWNEIESMPMDDFIKHYDTTRKNRYDEHQRIQADENARIEAEWRKDAADYFNVPVDKLTDEQYKQYNKFMDDLFKEEFSY